jgi:hypothetical protein
VDCPFPSEALKMIPESLVKGTSHRECEPTGRLANTESPKTNFDTTCAGFACAGLESNFEHRFPQIYCKSKFLRMNAIIGIHA